MEQDKLDKATKTNKTNKEEQRVTIQRIYLKDLSFEAPNTPDTFQLKWQPQLHLDLNSTTKDLKENHYEVALRITATVKNDDKVVFLIEAVQAGIFLVEGLSGQVLEHCLKSYCLSVLFPYGREVISDVVSRATFPQFILSPINFDALYAKQMEDTKSEHQDKMNKTVSAKD